MQVAHCLYTKLTQKTHAAQQWRKQALVSGVLQASLQGLKSQDQAIVEPCAGLVVPYRYSSSHKTCMRLSLHVPSCSSKA